MAAFLIQYSKTMNIFRSTFANVKIEFWTIYFILYYIILYKYLKFRRAEGSGYQGYPENVCWSAALVI